MTRPARRPVTINTLHTCSIDGRDVDHIALVTIHELVRVVSGVRYGGKLCDGPRIEWVEPRLPAHWSRTTPTGHGATSTGKEEEKKDEKK